MPLLLVTLALTGCGVVFSAGFEGTEVFREIELDGDFVPGSAVSVTVTVRQPYPVPLAIACAYENIDLTDDERRVVFSERAETVFETVLDPGPTKSAVAEEVPTEVLSFDFTVDETGTYFVACFTVAAPENGAGRRFTIGSP